VRTTCVPLTPKMGSVWKPSFVRKESCKSHQVLSSWAIHQMDPAELV
jgi:hypothetical protein